MRISHTKCETFISCPKKFEYRYIQKLYPVKVGSPLSFGKAFDDAANALLEGKTLVEACELLTIKMMDTHAETDYSMVDVDLSLIEHEKSTLTQAKQKLFIRELRDTDGEQFKALACRSLIERGHLYLAQYMIIKKRFHKVVEVQKDIRIDNGEGDELQIIIDFIVEMKGNELLKDDITWGSDVKINPDTIYKLVLDNKTSSKDYASDSVRNSDQLTTYNNIVKSDFAGFLVFDKRIKNGASRYQFFIDVIPAEKENKVFEKYQDTLYNINSCMQTNEFDKNSDSCFAFGRKCDYYNLCKYGKKTGLKEPKEK